MLKYIKKECCCIMPGIAFIVLGSLVDMAVPYFVGQVIDAMANE
jgi:ABC-type multidrug transport system fused ATPase/permease subunit